jgi:hypothetical protein
MRVSWLTLVDSVLRPARPGLERCLRARDEHLITRRPFSEERARAIARCERRIETARAAVFAANDGVVPARMTELEREWRLLSRPDPDGALMDLWARIAPTSWIDRKPWRDSHPAARLDAAVALAADPEGVEAAEVAVRSLSAALERWGVRIGARVRWRAFERDADCVEEMLAHPLRAAREALSRSDEEDVIVARAERIEREVHDAALARLEGRPMLARGIARAAFADFVFRAAALRDEPNPVDALRALWATGYTMSSAGASGVTLEIP